jgi:glucoamylase
LADAVACLEAAADRMLGALLYHADYLELSEQFDRDSGYEKSVRNLTCSYGSFLSAVRAKNQL